MLKIEEEVNIFNKLYTQIKLNENNIPLYDIGDTVFKKISILDYIIHGKDDFSIEPGFIVGKSFTGSLYLDEDNENDNQVYFIRPEWKYEILLFNKVFSKNYQHTNVVSNRKDNTIICSEGEIELLSNINDFVKWCDLYKLTEIKQEKLKQDEILAKKIGKIQERYLY